MPPPPGLCMSFLTQEGSVGFRQCLEKVCSTKLIPGKHFSREYGRHIFSSKLQECLYFMNTESKIDPVTKEGVIKETTENLSGLMVVQSGFRESVEIRQEEYGH